MMDIDLLRETVAAKIVIVLTGAALLGGAYGINYYIRDTVSKEIELVVMPDIDSQSDSIARIEQHQSKLDTDLQVLRSQLEDVRTSQARVERLLERLVQRQLEER